MATPLFVRDTHHVALTQAGRTLLVQARAILPAVEAVEMQLRNPGRLGAVGVGIAEDFASSRLPEILRQFREVHTRVRIGIEIDMSRTLLERVDRGQLDLALVKCLAADRRPEAPILSEKLVWVGLEERSPLARKRPLPLAVYLAPGVMRVIMLERLAAASVPWVITHTANTLSGLRAGVAAGIGISAFGRAFVPPGLRPLDGDALELPVLPALDFILARGRTGQNEAAQAIRDLMERNAAALHLVTRRSALMSE